MSGVLGIAAQAEYYFTVREFVKVVFPTLVRVVTLVGFPAPDVLVVVVFPHFVLVVMRVPVLVLRIVVCPIMVLFRVRGLFSLVPKTRRQQVSRR